MTTTISSQSKEVLKHNGAHEAIVDQLRACSTSDEILNFERWFNANANAGQLHEVICEFLRSRSISRGVAAKWLSVLLKDRDTKIDAFVKKDF